MASQLLVFALAFHREPLRFVHLTDPTRPLPDTFGKRLAEAAKALAPGRIQTSAAALDTRPEELQEAFLFFLRQTLLMPRADYYRVLGLSRHSSEASIKRYHGLMVRMFHPDRMPGEAERNGMLTARINTAYRTLCDPQARRRYDMSLPPLTDSDQSRIDASDFFRPSEPASKFHKFGRRRLFPINRLRWTLTWTVAISAFFALVFLALKDELPTLQINSELATGTAFGTAGSKVVQPPQGAARRYSDTGGAMTFSPAGRRPELSGIGGEEVPRAVPDPR